MWKRREFLAASGLLGFSSCQTTPRVVVGSKDSVENRLISEIVSQMLERKLQSRLQRQFGMLGSSVAYQSMQGGVVDVYPEYSRIAFKVLLKAQEQADNELMLEVMRKGFQQNAQASCLPFLGFQNTYTAVVLADNPRCQTIHTLSEAGKSDAGWRLGCTSAFAQSIEGYNELKLRYKLEESGGTRMEPVNQLFFGLRDHRIDMLITGSTDPRLRDPRYKVLEDDLHAFSPNSCTLVYRLELVQKYPEVLPVLQSLCGKIDSYTMQGLNGEIEVQKRGFSEVASEWITRTKLA